MAHIYVTARLTQKGDLKYFLKDPKTLLIVVISQEKNQHLRGKFLEHCIFSAQMQYFTMYVDCFFNISFKIRKTFQKYI